MLIYIYTDGAARGNPGPSASGYALYNFNHRTLHKDVFYNGVKTNNDAEYLAIIAAVKKTAETFAYKNDIVLFSDSELVINQLNGKYKVKSSTLKKLNIEAKELLEKFDSYKLNAIPRENELISEVDKRLNKLLDKKGSESS